MQSIAVDCLLDDDMDLEFMAEDNCLDLFKKATSRMPAMKRFFQVYEPDDYIIDHRNMELFENLPRALLLRMAGIYMDEEDWLDDLAQLPNCHAILREFDVPQTGILWGWRSTAPPGNL